MVDSGITLVPHSAGTLVCLSLRKWLFLFDTAWWYDIMSDNLATCLCYFEVNVKVLATSSCFNV